MAKFPNQPDYTGPQSAPNQAVNTVYKKEPYRPDGLPNQERPNTEGTPGVDAASLKAKFADIKAKLAELNSAHDQTEQTKIDAINGLLDSLGLEDGAFNTFRS